MNSSTAIEIQNLSVSFRDQDALSGVSATLASRQITVLIGPSGSGKTTLLRAINRLNEFFPGSRTRGTVRLQLSQGWVDAYRDAFPLVSLRRQAAMVFQNPNLLPGSIRRNFATPLAAVLGLSRREIESRMAGALEEIGLYGEVRNRLDDNAATLSGGQQQRLCLARALALEPTILLLDEPTASLDFRATHGIEELLLRLRSKYTIVAVSHSLAQAQRLADSVLLIDQGRIARTFDHEALHNKEAFFELVKDSL